MPTDSASISAYAGTWRAVAARLKFPVPERVRAYFESAGELNDIRDARQSGDAPDAEALLETLVNHVRLMSEAGIFTPDVSPVRSPVDTDRWRLIADLLARHDESIGEPGSGDWAPVRARAGSRFDVEYLGSFEGRRVELEFDGRISLRALITATRKLWPELQRRGLVRRTRGPEARGLALIRFVCLDAQSDRTWRDRWDAWERRYGNKWHYKDQRAFNTDFHRAERQLTGRPGGLAPFYERRANIEARSVGEVLRLAREGESDAVAVFADAAKSLEQATAQRALPTDGNPRQPSSDTVQGEGQN